jgi:hypothetical protein
MLTTICGTCSRTYLASARTWPGGPPTAGGASHSRWFWGLRLHLVCTLHGLPILFALTGAKAVDREVLAELLAMEPDLVAARPGQLLIADKNYYGREFGGGLAAWACGCWGRPAKVNPNRPVWGCSSRCGS